MGKFSKVLALILYYGLARHLPASASSLGFGVAGRLRGALCSRIFRKCGAGVNVERGVYFGRGSRISLGSHSGIGIDARFYGAGEVTIGENVLMAPEVVILTENHRFDDLSKPIGSQGSEISPVVIEDDVWIGLRVIILPGVTIGRSSVIAAGAVVAADVPPFSIAAGVPARVIRRRDAAPCSC